MADRYDVALFLANGPQTTDVRGYPTASMINALLDTIRVNLVKPGEYDAIVGLRGEETRGRIKVGRDGSLTIGARWGLPTPVKPIDRADLGIDVGVPDVG